MACDTEHPILTNPNPLYLRTASANLDWKTRFRIIAAKASRFNRNPNVYSVTEAPIRRALIALGFREHRSFFHEYRMLGYVGKAGHPVYYWLDFYLPQFRLAIEADGEIWHSFFDLKERDRRRDRILRTRYGIRTARLTSRHVRKKRIASVILELLRRRMVELSPRGLDTSPPTNRPEPISLRGLTGLQR